MVLPPLLYLEVLMCRLDLLRPLYLVDHLFQKDLEYLGVHSYRMVPLYPMAHSFHSDLPGL